MSEIERTVVATVRKPHGIKGGLKVSLHGIELEDLRDLSTLFVKIESGWQSYEIVGVQGTSTEAILLFKDIKDRETAESLRNAELWANESELPPLEEFEYHVADLEGCDVFDSTGVHYGKVKQVILHAEQDILEVLDNAGHEYLFPFVEQWIEEVDLDQQRIQITPWELR